MYAALEPNRAPLVFGSVAFYISRRRDGPAFHSNLVGTARHTENRMAWIYLLLAGLLEIGWAIGLKYTEGFTKLVPTVLTVASMVVSIALLGLAVKTLPIGTGYAIWTGIGAVGTAILGIALLGEPATAARIASIALIVAGIIGLKLAS